MKLKKLLLSITLFLMFIIPINTLAYSNYIIPGGENLGIKVNTKYVTIQGFYKVNDSYIGNDAGLEVGDKILKINDIDVKDINSMIDIINNDKDKTSIDITFLRNKKQDKVTLNLYEENGIYKTGLYVKDTVTGIGTLTYIDPSTKIFGSLGHMILDKNTSLKVEIKDGTIFKSEITGIVKSEDGNPGEKNAKFYSNDIYGNITKNEQEGIFGTYNNKLSDELIEVGDINDIEIGKAMIRTVIDGSEKEDFEITILEIDKNDSVKNILFEITDKELLNKTGGVVAGMSGSPIIQNNKIIGAVTHVVVNNTKRGYGISIKTMLEKGEE